MGLITKKVKVRWHVNNRKHYEKIGYVFTKYGDVFYADILDLPKCSKIIIKYECDNCHNAVSDDMPNIATFFRPKFTLPDFI